MKFNVLTLFPEMINMVANESILGRAQNAGFISVNATDIRDYSDDKNKRVDDYTYGGGAGMLMKAQPVYDAYMAASCGRKVRTVYMTPQGKPFNQSMAKELSREEELIILCGHYEGIDERVLDEIVTDRVSIGDYVLTGGELGALILIDAISRLVPGVLGNDISADIESFHSNLLEYPQYTRPEVWNGKSIPEVLLSGNTAKINAWRNEKSVELTKRIRPDLYEAYEQSRECVSYLAKNKRNNIHLMEAISRGLVEIRDCRLDTPGNNYIFAYLVDDDLAMIYTEADEQFEYLYEMIPSRCKCIEINGNGVNDQKLTDKGCKLLTECSNYLYTQKVPLKTLGYNMQPLDLSFAQYISDNYHYGDRKYIEYLLGRGALFGLFGENKELIGFIGYHAEGSMGLLYIKPEYRTKGMGTILESCLINDCLRKGYTPYCQVVTDNDISAKLQEKLSLYKSNGMVYWYSYGN